MGTNREFKAFLSSSGRNFFFQNKVDHPQGSELRNCLHWASLAKQDGLNGRFIRCDRDGRRRGSDTLCWMQVIGGQHKGTAALFMDPYRANERYPNAQGGI